MPDLHAVDVALGPCDRDVAVCQPRCTVRRKELVGLIIGMIHAPCSPGSHPVLIPVPRVCVEHVPFAAEENRCIVDGIQIIRGGGDALALRPPEVVDQVLVVGVGDHPLIAQDVDQLAFVQHAKGVFLGRRGLLERSSFQGIVHDPPLGKQVASGEQEEHQKQEYGLHGVCHHKC